MITILSAVFAVFNILDSVLLLGSYIMISATLIKEIIYLVIDYCFRGLFYYHHDRKYGITQAAMCWRSRWVFSIQIHGQEVEREPLFLTWPFETSKPTHNDTFPLTWPYFLILSNSATPFRTIIQI